MKRPVRFLIAALLAASAATKAEVTFTKVGHFGGATTAVEVTGPYVFYGQGADLLVYDTSASAELARLPLPDAIQKMVFVGDRLYAACAGAGLCIVDVTVKGSPRLVSTLHLDGFSNDLLVAPPYAIVVAANRAVNLVDISQDVHPRLVQSIVEDYYVEDAALDGSYLYLSDGINGIRVYDGTDLSQPRQIALIDNVRYNGKLLVSAGTLYASQLDGGLAVYDVSNPMAPVERAVVQLPGRSGDIDLAGQTLFVSNRSGGLISVDVADVGHPRVIGSVTMTAYDAALSGTDIFVAGGLSGLLRLSAADPSHATISSRLRTLGVPRGLYRGGGRLYVADFQNGLAVLDIANPAEIRMVQSFAVADPTVAAAFTQSFAFLACGPGGLRVVQLGAQLHQAGAYRNGSVYDVAIVKPQTLALARGPNGVELVDVSIPGRPTRLSRVPLGGSVERLAVRGSVVFAGNGSNLFAIDARNPRAPTTRTLPGIGTLGLAVQTRYLFAAGYGGLAALDASKATPIVLSTVNISPPQYMTSIDVSGAHAFLAAGYSGVLVYDVADRTHPSRIGQLLVTGVDQSLARWIAPYLCAGNGRDGGLTLFSTSLARQFERANGRDWGNSYVEN